MRINGAMRGLAGLCLLIAAGNAAWATDSSAPTPTTASDFIRALTPQAPNTGERIRTRGLALGTGDSAAPPAPAPASAPAPTVKAQPKPAPQISFQVEFEFNSATLSPQATAILNELGRALVSPELQGYRFQLTGHTDGVGSPKYNLDLSSRRAKSVKDYLSKTFAVAPVRLRAVGRGAQQLLDPANPASEVNRRVEIVNLGS